MKKKEVKDATPINPSSGSLRAVSNRSVVAVSKYNQGAAKLVSKFPKTVGSLVGVAIAATLGKYAYAQHQKKKAQDAFPAPANLENYVSGLGKSVVSNIQSFKVGTESGTIKNLKSLVMKNPKTAALIAGTAILATSIAMANSAKKNKEK